MRKLEIELVKGKILKGIILMIFLLIIFIWGLVKLNDIAAFLNIQKEILLPGFIVGVTLNSIFTFLIIKKIMNTKPGLIIDDSGLINNSTLISTKKIIWSDINQIREQIIDSNSHILIEVKDPKSYIDKETNPIKKWLMKTNTEKFNTPFMISSKLLNYDSKKLIDLLTDRIKN